MYVAFSTAYAAQNKINLSQQHFGVSDDTDVLTLQASLLTNLDDEIDLLLAKIHQATAQGELNQVKALLNDLSAKLVDTPLEDYFPAPELDFHYDVNNEQVAAAQKSHDLWNEFLAAVNEHDLDKAQSTLVTLEAHESQRAIDENDINNAPLES